MSIWEEIKNRVAIEEIISEYVQLLPAGQNFKCLSPFRQERTPSLIVSPSKKIWHDFGSGEGGDVFEFVARMENISRFEALKKIAQRLGIEVDSKPRTTESIQAQKAHLTRYEKGLKALAWSAELYHKVLLKILEDRSHPVIQYCLKRGLSGEIIQSFGIGYAPRDNFLLSLAQKYNLDLDLLVDIGVLKFDEQKLVYKDKFSDRLMIPIKDTNSRIVGFTGRVLDYDKTDRPKYLNSPQSEWFNKSKIWFGWEKARKSILQKKVAILVEGNMDVITAHSFGLTNVIASQGTSFTSQQLSFLKNYTDNLWLAFDNDDAGQVAGTKLFVEAVKMGFSTKKLIIPHPHKDLDEYLNYLAKTTNLGQIEQNLLVQDFFDWQIEQMQPLLVTDNLDKQRQAVLSILKLLALTDTITIDQYAGKLAKITGLSKTKLVLETEKIQQNQQTASNKTSQTTETLENISSNSTSFHILQSWQLVCSYFLFATHDLSRIKLAKIFVLLQAFFENLSQFKSFDEYLQHNQTILELIWETKKGELSYDFIQKILKSIIFYLDQKIDSLVLDPKKYELYSQIKIM